jgi:DNA polymerase-3 subunit alpha
MLGLYVSDHPLMGAEDALRRRCDRTIDELGSLGDSGGVVKVGGVCTSLQRKWTKKGDLMAVFQLEDLQSQIECMVFPKTMHEVGHLLDDDAVLIVTGRVDTRDDQPKLVAMGVEIFDGITDGAPPLRLKVPPQQLSERLLAKLRGLLDQFPGESEVFLHLGDGPVVRLPSKFNVGVTPGLIGEIRVLFGPGSLL